MKEIELLRQSLCNLQGGLLALSYVEQKGIHPDFFLDMVEDINTMFGQLNDLEETLHQEKSIKSYTVRFTSPNGEKNGTEV